MASLRFWRIREHRPDVIFGEQVEGPAGRAWLDLVFSDLEAIGYACGAVVFPAAGVGAPQIRHRTYWVAQSAGQGSAKGADLNWKARSRDERSASERGGAPSGLADADLHTRGQGECERWRGA